MEGCGRCLSLLMRPVLERLTVEGEEEALRVRKLAVFMTSVIGMVVVGVERAVAPGIEERGWLIGAWAILTFVNFAMMAGLLWALRHCSNVLFLYFVLSSAALTCLLDVYQSSGTLNRAGPLFIILLDLMLLGRMPRVQTFLIFGAIMAWLALMQAELTWRFGLLDVDGTYPPELRTRQCECARPPCSRAAGGGPVAHFRSMVQTGLALNFVFVMDFLITRRFATDAETERNRMTAAVATANSVAAALARFDLVAAETALATHDGELPVELLGSFQTLIENLGLYKAFLPQWCLPEDSRRTSSKEGDANSPAGREARDKDCISEHPSLLPDHPASACTTEASGRMPMEASASYDSDGSSNISTVVITPRSAANRRTALGVSTPGTSSLADPATPVRLPLSSTKISLLTLHGHIPVQTAEQYAAAHERLLAAVLACVKHERGVVDSFSADRVTASFNAVISCAVHAVSAVRAAVTLTKHAGADQLTGAVAMGTAMVGLLGTDTMLRQSVVGPLPGVADALHQFGGVCGYSWVCNQAAYKECRALFSLRVTLDHVLGGFGEEAPFAYELILPPPPVHAQPSTPSRRRVAAPPQFGQRRVDSRSLLTGEWMYELGDDEWETYNAAGELFVRHVLAETGDGASSFLGDASDAACLYLRSRGIEHSGVEWFAAAARAARTVHLRPRAVAPNGGGSSAVFTHST